MFVQVENMTSDKTPREIENIKKEICRIFKESNLRITIEANLKCVDFLDISMDLNTGIYQPYMKPNNIPSYVHAKSNHPPSIIKNIPVSINKWLSDISSNEDVFNKAVPIYQEALRKNGHEHKLRYNPTPDSETNSRKRARKRNVIWFNPLFNLNISTSIGAKFLRLIDKFFPNR